MSGANPWGQPPQQPHPPQPGQATTHPPQAHPQQHAFPAQPGASWQSGPTGWLPQTTDPRTLPGHLRPSLPVEQRDYYAFWRSPRYRWWKGVLAILLGAFAYLVTATILQFIGWAIDEVDWSVLASGQLPPVGPGFFLANNVSLALGIPIAGLTAWLCVQQRPRWLSSVQGGLRWRWLVTLSAVLLPLWVLMLVLQIVLAPSDDLSIRDHTWVMIVGILLTTPLQAAGEEYLVRGLLGRAVGSWFAHPGVGFAAATVVTALVFMAMHGAGDPWLNAFYIVFALVGTWVTWRTGGLEAAIAIHVVNNLVNMALLPFSDFSGMFDREAGVGDASLLLYVGLLVIAVVIVEWWVRRRPLTRTTAPGAVASPRA